MSSLRRRIGVLCAALLGLCSAACTRASTEPPFTLTQVGPNAWAAIHNAKAASPAWVNAGFVIGDDGVAVIDTFMTAETAELLLREIRTRTSLPVRFVINTHYHFDHSGGNGVFAKTGALVLAHRHVREWIHTENLRLMGPSITSEQKLTIQALVAPALVYDEGVTLNLGSRRIQVRSFPGHTGGDSVVVIPDAKIVFGGDLLFHGMLPTTVDGSMQPWIDTLDALMTELEGYTFVPGHGEVGHRQEVAAFRNYLLAVHTLVQDARAQGKSGDALLQAVMPALKEKYGHMEAFDATARLNVIDTEAELNGTKRLPPTTSEPPPPAR